MIGWLLNLFCRPPKPPAPKPVPKRPPPPPKDPEFDVRVVPHGQDAHHWTVEYRHGTPFWIRLTKAHVDENIHPNRWNLTHPWLFDSQEKALDFVRTLTYDFIQRHLREDREHFNLRKVCALDGITSRSKIYDVFPRKPS